MVIHNNDNNNKRVLWPLFQHMVAENVQIYNSLTHSLGLLKMASVWLAVFDRNTHSFVCSCCKKGSVVSLAIVRWTWVLVNKYCLCCFSYSWLYCLSFLNYFVCSPLLLLACNTEWLSHIFVFIQQRCRLRDRAVSYIVKHISYFDTGLITDTCIGTLAGCLTAVCSPSRRS